MIRFSILSSIFSNQTKFSLFSTLVIATITGNVLADEREGMGLPECELIVGVDRYITIGDTISHTIDYLEGNKYSCDDFTGKSNEIVSCTYSIDYNFEVLLIVENGIVTDIETFYGGLECSYFNTRPLLPSDPDVN